MGNDILAKGIELLPFTLAHPLHGFMENVEKENWSGAMNYALDFFETSSQFLSIVLMGYLKTECKDIRNNRIVVKAIGKIDNKRPLSFGDWVNDILTPLAILSRSMMPDNSFVKSLSNVVSSKNNIILGRKGEQSIVKIRNDYKGHGTTLSQDIYKDITLKLEGRLVEFTERLMPLSELKFMADVPGIGRLQLNGQKPMAVSSEFAFQEGHYYISDGSKTIDLFPLAYCIEKGHIYIFQTLKDENTVHISSNEEAVSMTTDTLNAEFDAWMQDLMPSFDISKTLNWEQWTGLLSGNTSSFLTKLYAEKKYNRELFVERESLSRELDSFLDSDTSIFPLLGEAGQGKTTQLCYWTETLSDEDCGVMIFSGSEFAGITLEYKLKHSFGWAAHKPVSGLVKSLADAAMSRGKKVLILIDAINECIEYPGLISSTEGPLMLFRDLYRLFIDSGYNCFKILFTCRNYTWKNIIMPEASRKDQSVFYNSGTEENTAVKGFTDTEVRNAYHIYGDLYQMKTPFELLPRGITIRMKDPLVLKMACTNYLGQYFPEKMREFTSLALFHKMVQDISISYAGNRQVAIIREIAGHILSSYESGNAIDSITMSELKEAACSPDAPLYKAATLIFKKDGYSVAFAELLNKPERPILRLADNEKIQFIYERFLEYMLALIYFEKNTKGQVKISHQTLRATIKKATANEVFMGAMRNVLIMDYLSTGSPDTIIKLSTQNDNGFEIVSLATDVMNVMVRENYETEIFSLLGELIDKTGDNYNDIIPEYNAVTKIIETNKADEATIARHKELNATIAPLIKQRSLASVTLFNGLMLTDYHNEGIYSQDPFVLLWKLLLDPVTEVKNDVCMYAYYISNKKYTLSGTPLRENLSEQIVKRMYKEICTTPLIAVPFGESRRKSIVSNLEIGTRLNVLMIIDVLISGNETDRSRVGGMLDETVAVFRHLTADYTLIRLLLPFFQMVLRKQLTFQSDYVNNVIEYQTFWEDSVIPRRSKDGSWCREDIKTAMKYIYQYSRYHSSDARYPKEEAPDFSSFQDKVISAYRTGDSFTYFALERILIIIGLCSWEDIYPILKSFREGCIRDTEWFDYSQMSIIYILYQFGMKMGTYPEYAWEMLAEWCEEWTLKCKGFFKGRNSHKANTRQLYKRNTMTWYAMVWACRHGDERNAEGTNVPLFRKLINDAIENRDTKLLVHLIENISELVTDSGYIHTALDLLLSIIGRIDSEKMLNEFNEDIVTLIGKVLGTTKNYFPDEVNSFLKRDLSGLPFPGIPKYKDELLSYNPGGERLSDLFTHKFGNFLIWSLIHEEAVDEFAYEAMCLAPESKDSFEWFDKVVRVLFRHLFKVKL
ncbi:MAG: hypothetical protein IJ971_02790 [Bacteroidales bacterium]|nr:hypothetical protein [Bacteroidales bacterium]